MAEDAALKIVAELVVLCVNGFHNPIYTLLSWVGGCSGGAVGKGNLQALGERNFVCVSVRGWKTLLKQNTLWRMSFFV